MLFSDLTEAGVLRMMDLGGGFPVRYKDDVPEIDRFTAAIMTAMVEHFGNNLPEMVIEPGHASSWATPASCRPRLCWCAGARQRIGYWVYLDIGRFGGLAGSKARRSDAGSPRHA